MTFDNFNIIKKRNTLSKIYKFGVIFAIYIYTEINFLILKNNYIIIKNSKGEPKTLAKIVVQNRIDYIPKVSVIIPTYNSGNFLIKCLETIINQTLKEIEIICVDNGSIDNTLDILKNYSKKDERITILKQTNSHAGAARNAGLALAKGKYLSILDSDNFFDLNMLKEMYDKILKEKSDVIICQIKTIDYYNNQLNEESLNNSLSLDLILNKNNFSVQEISNNIFQIFESWTCDKLFRTDFILSNNIKFQNIINYYDNQFTYIALCKAKSITTIQKRFVNKIHKMSLSLNIKKDPLSFILSINRLKYNLKISNLYNLVKTSFWEWVIHICI